MTAIPPIFDWKSLECVMHIYNVVCMRTWAGICSKCFHVVSHFTLLLVPCRCWKACSVPDELFVLFLSWKNKIHSCAENKLSDQLSWCASYWRGTTGTDAERGTKSAEDNWPHMNLHAVFTLLFSLSSSVVLLNKFTLCGWIGSRMNQKGMGLCYTSVKVLFPQYFN